jgi:hypothetical protein
VAAFAAVGAAQPAPDIIVPVEGIRPSELIDSWNKSRAEGRLHRAIDIPAPQGTPVLAAMDGRIEKLFASKRGGLTIYQRSTDGRLILYYAHLKGYRRGLAEGATSDPRAGDRHGGGQRQRRSRGPASSFPDTRNGSGKRLAGRRAGQSLSVADGQAPARLGGGMIAPGGMARLLVTTFAPAEKSGARRRPPRQPLRRAGERWGLIGKVDSRHDVLMNRIATKKLDRCVKSPSVRRVFACLEKRRPRDVAPRDWG